MQLTSAARPAVRRGRLDRPRAGAALLLGLLCLLAGGGASAATLQLELGGRATAVDVYAPPGEPTGDAVILAHGFTRDRTTMAGHARMLAGAGVWAIVPDLPYLMDSRDNAVALRDLVAALQRGAAGQRLGRFVLVGFSAGGLSALLAADAPGVVGYIGLDPFDRPGGVGLEAARKLRVPAYLLRGPSAACNAYAIAAPWVTALPALVVDRQLPGASHCDFESPTDSLCQFVCGSTDPQRQAMVREFLGSAVHDLLAPPTATAAH